MLAGEMVDAVSIINLSRRNTQLLAGFTPRSQALTVRLTRAGVSGHTAQPQAMGATVRSRAVPGAVLSYVDMYWLLAMASVIMFVASFLLKRNEPGKGAEVYSSLACTKPCSLDFGSMHGVW
jgi:hypothetical protein